MVVNGSVWKSAISASGGEVQCSQDAESTGSTLLFETKGEDMLSLFSRREGVITMRCVREVLKKQRSLSHPQDMRVSHGASGVLVWVSKYSLLKQRLGKR